MILAIILVGLVATSNAGVPTKEYRIALSSMCNDVASAFEIEYRKFMRTGIESETLASLTGLLTHTKAIQRMEVENLSVKDQSFLCTACRSTINVLIDMARENIGDESDYDEELMYFATEMCIRLKIQPEEVCRGVINLNAPIFIFIMRNSNVTAEGICGTLLQGSSCVLEEPEFDWKINIDGNGPVVKGHKSEIPSANNNELKILHLTDIHYDPNYTEGALADCDEPLCCIRKVDNITDDQKAGRWGDYRNCDVSWDLYVDSLNQIKSQHKNIDYIYYTGDVIEHAVWYTTEESIKKSLNDVYQKLQEIFGDIPVFPIIGNHESQPLNVFAPPNVRDKYRTQWLYDFLSDQWSKWLPEETRKTMHQDGYYTVSPKTGFRIIALNNNDCYTFNWWVFYNPEHLSKQLQWLHNTLLEAEKSNEYVHILAHVPSGVGSCVHTWSREYRRIIQRFHHIISGVFNGHTHDDEFNVFYSNEDSKYAINIGWNGGGLAPYADVNPNYRIYDVEPETYQVVDHETYIFNLTEANLYPHKSPVWFKEYSFKEFYGLKDLSPASMDGLLNKFTEQPELLLKYWELKKKQGDPEMKRGCDSDCLMKQLCETATTQYNDMTKCIELQKKLQITLDKRN